jgi:hypothetical protein
MRAASLATWLIVCSVFINFANAQITNLSDEFEGVSLDPSWQHYQNQYYTASVDNGQLSMDIDGANCNNNCAWYHAQSAGFIYKLVSGNFEVVCIARSEEASGSNIGDDIANDTQLGGLLARNGLSVSQNYVFNVIGTRFDVPSIETKSTSNNNSGTIEHFGVSSTEAELRMIREGSVFTMYSRDLGATEWTQRSTFSRPDLPDTLQVGVIAYAFESYPEDLVVKFDYVRFSDLVKVNKWLGGSGLWQDAGMWSINSVPDSTHSVIIDNPQAQTIQILPAQQFKCLDLDIQGSQTEFIVDGQFEVKSFD